MNNQAIVQKISNGYIVTSNGPDLSKPGQVVTYCADMPTVTTLLTTVLA